MTAKETERLAKVEQKVDDLKESTDNGFNDLKKNISDNNEALNKKLDAFIRHADQSFITKAQTQAAGWVIGVFVTLIGLWIAFKSK